MSHLSLPTGFFVCAVACLLAVTGCDTFGGDGGEEPRGNEPTIATLWNGTYAGSGREIDFFPSGTDEADTQVELTVALRDSQTLQQLRLSWNDGANFAQTSGGLETLSRDSLVTPIQRVEADSFNTRFQFRLVRDSVTADSILAAGDSVRIAGTLRQFYEEANADSTVVEFTVTGQ